MSNALELVALCKALHTFQPWIFGGAVTAVVDNQALLAFNNPSSLSSFVKRRLDELLFFAPSLQFCSGPFHFWPDFLSRQGGWGVGREVSCQSSVVIPS